MIRAGGFASVGELVRSRNAMLIPSRVWRAEGADILAKTERARAALLTARTG
jgi:hypothetical protein